MTCEELRDDYYAWALGIAEDPAQSEIAAHLARECPVCSEGIRGALATVAAMSGAVKDAEPPKRLRRRVITLVAPEPSRVRAYLPWAISALLAIVLLSIAIPRSRPQAPQDAERLAQVLSILNDPITKEVSFGDPAARGRVFAGSKGVVLIAAHLPKLAPGHTFEMWILPPSGNPVPSGTFHGEQDATALFVAPGPPGNAAAVAVTVEPEGGSPQPTTAPFIVTKL